MPVVAEKATSGTQEAFFRATQTLSDPKKNTPATPPATPTRPPVRLPPFWPTIPGVPSRPAPSTHPSPTPKQPEKNSELPAIVFWTLAQFAREVTPTTASTQTTTGKTTRTFVAEKEEKKELEEQTAWRPIVPKKEEQT